MSEKDTSDSLLKSRIDTNSTPGLVTDARESLDLDPQTSQVTHDVPLVPRLTPEPVPDAQRNMIDGLSEEKTTNPKVYSQADQWESVSSLPDPRAGSDGITSINELMLEGTREGGLINWRERMTKDRVRDSATMGFGDDQEPQPFYSKDESMERFQAPVDPQANVDMMHSPDKPSQPAGPYTINAMWENMQSMVVNLQKSFWATLEALTKNLDIELKKIRVEQFKTPSEGEELP